MARQKKALVLIDLLNSAPENQDYSDVLGTEDWKNQSDVYKALKNLGYDSNFFGLYDNLHALMEQIKKTPPDIIFNLCEAYLGQRVYEPQVAALLELLHVPFTGSGSEALSLCKDKGLTKKILTYHRIRVPKFVVSHRKRPLRRLRDVIYPAFIKPLGLEASEGIAQMSFVESEKDGLDRIKYLHDKLETDVIVEEFIEGRELYVGLLGRQKIEVFPPRELFFKGVEDSEFRFATFKAKWDEGYRKRHQIATDKAEGIDEKTQLRIVEVSRKIFSLFRLRGYARLDFRLRSNGDLVFIEANPNPSIAKEEDFAASAKAHGYSYDELIEKIIRCSVNGG